MFTPNAKCRIQLASGKNNVFGQPVPGKWVTEPCSVVRVQIKNMRSSVRADQSAAGGTAMEIEADAVILLLPNTKANIDDILVADGYTLRILGIEPRRDAGGRMDHFAVTAVIWSVK
jgi:hypothetical protein